MKNFWGYATNGEFSVGCTGQTVYLYDKNNNEMCKFKDIIYGYLPVISPNGKIFVVKSTVDQLAVYSLETFSLINKFRFSKGGSALSCCFSPDSKYFINLESHRKKGNIAGFHDAISIYNTSDFSLVKQIHFDEKLKLFHIEFDENTNTYYLLGAAINFEQDSLDHFVAKFEDQQVKNITPISENEYDFYLDYMFLKSYGFTKKAYAWSHLDCDLDKLKSLNHTLAKLYMYHNK